MAEEKPGLAWALGGSILNVEEIAVSRKAREEGRENMTPVFRLAESCGGASNTKKSQCSLGLVDGESLGLRQSSGMV